MSLNHSRWLGVFASLAMLLAVAMGAFSAHGLRDVLSPAQMTTLKTAVLYQFIHALAILLIITVRLHLKVPRVRILGISNLMFAVGIVLFCGSLYGLTLADARWLGPVTPLGGLAFLFGWLSLTWFFITDFRRTIASEERK